MEQSKISEDVSIGPQITAEDVGVLAADGFQSIICNRPDGEGGDQPNFDEIEAAARANNIEARYLPVLSGKVSNSDVADFSSALQTMPAPVYAYCRSGMRSATLWSLSQADNLPLVYILDSARSAGYDVGAAARRIASGGKVTTDKADGSYDVVIVGGGAAGISVASSLMARSDDLDIAIIDPADVHYYQPGWTMVGGGIFQPSETAKTMGSLIPSGAHWIKAAVAAFEPDASTIILEGCRVIKYKRLIVCPGLKLDWHGIEGLSDTLGKNGVTSNYRYDLAPYTWELVRSMKSGRAVFTQPPMPIKCAGAPQKAMYLSGDHWRRMGVLKNIDIAFHNAGGALFGVPEYVPALMEYVDRYDADLNFFNNLTTIDGNAKKAWFTVSKPDTKTQTVEVDFDMLHVCPPQTAPDFIKASPLSDVSGWVDVDQATLRHKTYDNIWSMGDVMNAPNAKTAAAARKQAPVIASNVVADIAGKRPVAQYDGYGSCPLTVERGKIVLAEFGYGGKLLPSFAKWCIDGQKPSRIAWLLKEQILPPIYWKAMLRGREWMAKPEMLNEV